MSLSALTELEALLAEMPAAQKAALDKTLAKELSLLWRPNPGPQLDACFSRADEVFFGGQAGGGKTDLAVGLALTNHRRSLILRRFNKDAEKIVPRVEEIVGHRDGYNSKYQRWRIDGRQIEFSGCEMEADKQRFKGDPHDLIVFDEGTDFLESQYRFIIGWNRSADPSQRCRVMVTSNPPTTADGLWVIQYWAPWLDPAHSNPAKPGELRWFTTVGGVDLEVDGPGPHVIDGEPEPVMARSRTFIPSRLSDNPDLSGTGYASVLAALPDELRRAYRDGDFGVSLKDAAFQVIPTSWIVEAQNRWTPALPEGFAMTAIGGDVSFGGDTTQLAPRYGGWFAPLVSIVGEDTKDGSLVAARIVQIRRDRCSVVIDMGGGYGGAVSLRLADNGIEPIPFNGANSSVERANDGSNLQFANKRAEAHWRLREALDPNQEGGSIIALPPDAELKADLAAPTWKLTPRGILVESKEDIRKRIGRSPDKGDAVVMCWSEGQAAQRLKGMPMPSMANRGYGEMKSGFGGNRGAFPSRANVGTKRLA